LPAAYLAALCLSLAGPFAPSHAATESLESSPGPGFVISADYEDLRPGLVIARADKEEATPLEFLTRK